VLVSGGIDLWSRPIPAAGVRAALPLAARLRATAALRYASVSLDATGQAPVVGSLEGAQHSMSLHVGGELGLGDTPWVARAEAGPVWVVSNATSDAADASGSSIGGTLMAGIGPRWRIGRFDLGVEAGASVTFVPGNETWDQSPLRFHLEVSGGTALAR
jgi:hypothetical protein